MAAELQLGISEASVIEDSSLAMGMSANDHGTQDTETGVYV